MIGSNSDSIQKTNRNLVLSLLRRDRISTRADISKKTGLKGATITNIVADLIASGIVLETGYVEGSKGRRSIGISLNDKDYQIIAIRLSRLYFQIALYNLQSEIICKDEIEIDISKGVEIVEDLMKESISNYLTKTKRNTLAIGVALPGPYLKTENTILQISGFPGWEGVNIADSFEKVFGIPTYVEHDGKASAFAEWWHGDYSKETTLLNVIAGQGNGLGIIAGGSIISGSHGTAGEFGHTTINYDGPQCACGNKGCLDLYCSTIVLKKQILANLPNNPNSLLNGMKHYSLPVVQNAVVAGDKFAISEVQKISKYLGYGLVNAINVFDPNVIIIGDDLATIGQNYVIDEIQKVINSRVLEALGKDVHIQLSKLGDSILLGAMTIALDKVFQELKFME